MLLINENLAVSRIINLIAHRENLEVEEFETLEDVVKKSYEYILIDNDTYKDGMIGEIKGRLKYRKLIFITPKNGGKPLGFDGVLFKPFLPLDFLTIIGKNNINSDKSKEKDVKKRDNRVEIKEQVKQQINEKLQTLTSSAINVAFSNSDLREILEDVEINIKISFDFKNKEQK